MDQPVSVVVPAFNEEKRLPATLDSLLRYCTATNFPVSEILVINDGSRDRTREVVAGYAVVHPTVRLLDNPGNCGKGYAVRHGMLAAKGEWVLFSDADLSTPIEEIEKLLDAAHTRSADVVIGSRALDRSLIGVRQSALREYSGRAFNAVMRLVTRLPFADTQCGFKLFRRAAAQEIFKRQQLDGFSFDVEDLIIARRLRMKVIEVPVRWNNVEGTKVSTLQGLKSFADLVRIRWYELTGRYA